MEREREILDRMRDASAVVAVMDTIERFPGRLKKARENKGMKSCELAEMAGMKRCTISLYEHGQGIPDMIRLSALAACLDVSADWLMGKGE